MPLIRPEKKSTKINSLIQETARWGGGLPREGVVVEKFVLALESLCSLGFEERKAFFCQTITAISRLLPLEFWCSEGHFALFCDQFWLVLTHFAGQT